MQTPLQLDFHGIDVSPAARQLIEERVDDLEQRFGRITACRVVVGGPGERHRSGGLYDVRVHISLPNGKQVSVDRLDHADERTADIRFAIGRAFDHARRRLQDQVRRLQGKTKTKTLPPQGSVESIDPSGEFGFLRADDGRIVYFHRNSVVGEGAERLQVGARVSFAEEEGEKGPQASTVRALGKHGMRIVPAST